MKKNTLFMKRAYSFLIFMCCLFFCGCLSCYLSFAEQGGMMKIFSPEFENMQMIPQEFTCQGEDVSPALEFEDIPDAAKSLVLIVDDPDAPVGTWIHWVVYDIVPKVMVGRGEIPGIQGINDFRKTDYGGPCPPSGTHRYFFKLYALDAELGLKPGVTKQKLLTAMQGHILDQAELVGLYEK